MKKRKLVRIISIILVMTMITACGSKGNENDIETVKEKELLQ